MMSVDRAKLTKQAEGHLISKHPAKAIDIFLKLLDDSPKDLSLANKIGDIYLQVNEQREAATLFKRAATGFEEEGFLNKAIAVFKKALRACPEDTDTAERLADLYKRTKMPRDAIQMHIHLADSYAKKGDSQRALKELAEVASLDPKNTKNKIRLAELFANEGMKERAAEIFLESAEMLAKQNMPQEAAQTLERAKSIAATAQVFLAQSRISAVQNDFDGAIGHLDEGIKAHPKNADLLGAKAEALIYVQRPLDALRTLAEIPSLPEDALAICEKALKDCHSKSLAQQGLDAFSPTAFEAAKRGMGGLVKRALHNALNPQGDNALPDYWLIQAEVARLGGFQEGCVESLKYALGLMAAGDSRLEATRKQLQDLGVGDADMAAKAPPDLMRQDKSATSSLSAELALQAKRLTSEGELHEGKGKFPEAINAYQGVLAIDPTNLNAIERITELHKASGMLTKAQLHLCKVAEKIASLGERGLAVYYLDKAEALMPGSTRIHRFALGLLDVDAQEPSAPSPAALDAAQQPLETVPAADGPTAAEPEKADMQALAPPEEMATPVGEPDTLNELDGQDLATPDAHLAPRQGQEGASWQTEQPRPPDGQEADPETADLGQLGQALGHMEFQSESEEEADLPTQAPPEEMAWLVGEQDGLNELDGQDLATPDAHLAPRQGQEEACLPTQAPPKEMAWLVGEQDEPNELDGQDLATPDAHLTPRREPEEASWQIEQPPEGQDAGPETADLGQLGQAPDSIDFQPEFEILDEAAMEAMEIGSALPTMQGGPEQTDNPEAAEENQKMSQTSADGAGPTETDVAPYSDPLEMPDFLPDPAQSADEANGGFAAVGRNQTTEELISAFKEGVNAKVGGDDHDTHYSLGIAYKAMMLADAAIEEFKKAMADPERTLECCSMLALCERMRGDLNAAAQWLHVGICAPGFPPADSKGLLLELAALLEEMGSHEEAEVFFQEAKDLDDAVWVELEKSHWEEVQNAATGAT